MKLQVRRLAHGLGAEVQGLDLSKPFDRATFEAVHAAWMEHLVLVFPGQQLTGRQFADFNAQFGDLEILGSYQGLDEYLHPDSRGILIVTNRNLLAKEPSRTREIGRRWHADRSFVPQSPISTCLYCQEIPDIGGDTMFANQYMAYETLSDTYKKILEGLSAIHYVGIEGRQNSLQAGLSPEQLAEKFRQNPPTVRPIVRTHNVTGKKCLFVSEAVTTTIVGMTKEESGALLDYLYKHQVRPEFTYRHHYTVGDVVLWDNRCAMHLAPVDFDRSQPRTMLRTSVLGEVSGRVAEPSEYRGL